jgi:hypothetical protein
MPRATPKSSNSFSRSRGTKAFSRPLGQADELMELAVDAAESRHLPEFLERFAKRAARMLDAMWGGVTVFRGRETDLYQTAGGAVRLEAAQQSAIIGWARENRRETEVRTLLGEPALSGLADATAAAVVLVPITASDHETLGCLCLLRSRKTLDDVE